MRLVHFATAAVKECPVTGGNFHYTRLFYFFASSSAIFFGNRVCLKNILRKIILSLYILNGYVVYRVKSHHHHHIVLAARISLTLSRHSSLSFIALGRSSGQQPVSSHSCWMYVRAGRPAFARPCVGIHKSTSLKTNEFSVNENWQ